MISITPGLVLKRTRPFQTQLASAFNGMHSRLYTTREHYWNLYNTNKDRLGVFSTISAPAGGWHSPVSGEMMTEWGFPEDDCPFIGIHERWEIDPMDQSVPPKRLNLQITYWTCVPVFDTDLQEESDESQCFHRR